MRWPRRRPGRDTGGEAPRLGPARGGPEEHAPRRRGNGKTGRVYLSVKSGENPARPCLPAGRDPALKNEPAPSRARGPQGKPRPMTPATGVRRAGRCQTRGGSSARATWMCDPYVVRPKPMGRWTSPVIEKENNYVKANLPRTVKSQNIYFK